MSNLNEKPRSQLMQEIIKAIQPLEGRLQQGERIALQTTEYCCNVKSSANGETTKDCHLCGGKGWIFDSLTLRGKEAGP